MMNFIILQGNLVDKPVYNPGENGKKSSIWGKMGVYQGTDSQGAQLPSMFVEFTAFGKEADTLAQFANKGDLIIASGRFSETQTTGSDGRVYNNKKIVGNAKMCYKLPSQNQNVAQQPQQYGNFNQQMNQGLTQMGIQQPQQYQAQPMTNNGYTQVTNSNQSMWG